MTTPTRQYTIRRKFFKVFGAAFHILDEHGSVIGYCKQRAFKIREDIRLYTGEDMSDPLLTLRSRNIIDFGATYDVAFPDGSKLGSLRRKGLKSSFIRDEWQIFNHADEEIASVHETGSFAPITRRYLDMATIFFPQHYEIVRSRDGKAIASLRQHFNPFIFRMGVSIIDEDDDLDDLLILGAACLISAIEGRQN